MFEEVETRNISGGSRLNRFLLDKKQCYCCIFGRKLFKQAYTGHTKIHL